MKAACTFSLLLLAVGTSFGSTGWERYEPILARSPFGKPEAVEEVAAPAHSAGQLEKLYRLCAIYEGVDGLLRAGVVNRTNNKSTSLMQGEPEEGLELLEVRFESGEALVRNGTEQAWLKLQGVPFTGTPVNASPAETNPQGGNDSQTNLSLNEVRQRSRLMSSRASRPRFVHKPKSQASDNGADGNDGRGASGGHAQPQLARSGSPVSHGPDSVKKSAPNYNIQSVPSYKLEQFKERL